MRNEYGRIEVRSVPKFALNFRSNECPRPAILKQELINIVYSVEIRRTNPYLRAIKHGFTFSIGLRSVHSSIQSGSTVCTRDRTFEEAVRVYHAA